MAEYYKNLVFASFCIAVLLGAIFYLSALIVKYFVSRNGRRIVTVVPPPSPQTDHDQYRYHPVPLGYHGENFEVEEYQNFSRSKKRTNLNHVYSRPHYPGRRPDQRYQPHAENGKNLIGYRGPLKASEISGSKSYYNAEYSLFLIACWDCDIVKIKASIELGADTLEKTKSGETGLILATYRMAKGKRPWNPDCLELLLKNGCPINEVTIDHNTALHLAVKAGHLPSIEWLLAHGACVRIPNKLGWRPMAIAKAKGLTDVMHLLWENYSEEIKGDQNEGTGRSSAYHSASTCIYCEAE